jgi:hypothetical protein
MPSEDRDKDWILTQPALAKVFVNHNMAIKGLRRARDIAFAAVWHWARDNDRELFGRLPRSPLFMKASHGELEWTTSDWKVGHKIKNELEDLPILRNFLAHPGICSTGQYGYYLSIAERLCRRAGDEAGLRKLHQIRETWRVEAERTLAEIEERETLFYLPRLDAEDRYTEPVWKDKHMMVFRLVLEEKWPEGDPRGTFPVVIRAARTWAEQALIYYNPY